MLTCRRAQRFVFPYKMSWPHELGNNWSVRCCWPSASVYRKPVHFTNVWYSRYNNAARAQSQRTRLQIHRRTTAVVSVQRNSPSRSKQRRPCFSTLVSLSFSSCYGNRLRVRPNANRSRNPSVKNVATISTAQSCRIFSDIVRRN